MSRTRFSPKGTGRSVVGLAFATLLLAPTLAVAEPCANPTSATALTDPAGFVWDTSADGEIVDGGGFDTYDTANTLSVTVGANPNVSYAPPDTNGCVREDGAREIVFPAQTNNGLEISRKLYVPAAGTSFARWLNVLHNPTAGPLIATVNISIGDLGSDNGTKVVASSSGDLAMAVGDAWVVTDDSLLTPVGGSFGDPAIIHAWQGTAAGVDGVDAMPTVFETNTDQGEVTFQNITVPAGGTAIVMGVEAARFTTAQATDGTAAVFGRGSSELFAGLSNTEKAQIINWPTTAAPDGDGDGIVDSSDNCALIANSDQLNTDNDALGNVCDADDDGDTTSDADELVRGTDPLKADSDGDGRNDPADACPTQAGLAANGCVDTTAPTTTVTTRPQVTLRSFRTGIRARALCNEACSVQFELLGTARLGNLKAVGDVVLASRSFASSTVARSAVLRPRASLIGTVRRFNVRLRVTTVDQSGNRRVVTRIVRVR